MKQLSKILTIAVIATALAACNKEVPKPDTDPAPTARTVTAEQLDYSTGAAQKPRYLVSDGGKVYVSCGYPPAILRIDTVSGTIDRMLKFNTDYDLEGIAVAGNKLFAASSFIRTESGSTKYDSIVMVVDLATFSLDTVLNVPTDPRLIKAVDANHVVVACGYDVVGGTGPLATSALIDATTCQVTPLGHGMNSIDTYNGLVYSFSGGYSDAVEYYCLNPLTNSRSTILDGCNIDDPYGINILDGNIFLTTHSYYYEPGDVVRFNSDNSVMWRSMAGMLPSKVVPLADGTAYVLNEGNWGQNEASLSRVDMTTGSITNNVFSTANGRGLGDVAQDLVVYGTKAYITVSFSNTVEIVDISDNTSRQIRL